MARDEEVDGKPAESDEDILSEMRRRWEYATTEWADIRKEGQTDMQYCAGNPWTAKDKRARKDAGRPCLALDELSQYVNQLVNDVRQNKRAIKVTPMGEGANDATANLKEGLIRQIEYRSNAQQAYTTMFENTVQRSYGFTRVISKYLSDDSFDQELLIEPVVNPDMVTVDPDALRADGSDMRYAWIREARTLEEFKREFPTAKTTDFGTYLSDPPYKAWIEADKVYIAEYWTLKAKKRELLLLNTVQGPQQVFADELEQKPSKGNILQSRSVESTSVVKYITNGVEILSKTDWPGQWIPIVTCFGKVLYLDGGEGSKRNILSMIRLARDPYMLYCYYRTAEAELVGMTPKTPFIGYEGQFRGHEDDWAKVNHEPKAYLEAKPVTEGTGQQILPLPQRQSYDPPIQALEIGAEAARRAIQAAIGSSPLPTQAQRRNEKSGVALKQIEETAQKGSFHFIDHYEDAITRTGAILNDLLPHFYDTARDVAIRDAQDDAKVVRINDPGQPNPETGQLEVDPRSLDDKTQQPLKVEGGPYDVTLSTGPSYDSERELASEFADTLVQTPLVAQVAGPAAAAKVLSLAIKLKNLGPLGTEMADVISPPQDKQNQIPPEVQQQMQQMGQALQEAQQQIAMDTAKQQAMLQKAQIDAQSDAAKAQLDAQTDGQKAQIDADVRIKIATIQAETAIATAQIAAGQADITARLKHLEAILGHKADFLLQEQKLAHDDRQMDKEHAQSVDEGERDHQQSLEQGEQGHQHSLEEGEQGAMAAERQIEKQAEVAPRPEA